MIYVAGNEDNRRIGLKEITGAIDSPEAFTAKILQQLVRSKLLDSFKGPKGGFKLVENKVINLADVVLAIDGDKLLEGCVLGLPVCSDDYPCPVHDKFLNIRNQLRETLLSTDLRDKNLLTEARLKEKK